ncbi:MAG: zinc-ribbon domain-containing protein, partial [Bacteroidota bacterium]
SPDSTSPDSTSPDSTSPDSTSPDSTSPDSTSPDSTSPDSASPDSASPDSASPDSASPATDHTDIHYTPPPLEPLPDVTEEDLLEDALILEEITPESQTESGLCNNCGADLPEGARFCPQCGHPVDDTPVKTQNFASPSSPPPPPPTDTEGSPHLRKSEPNTPPHGEQHFQDPDHSFTNTRGKNLGGIDWDGSLMTDFRTFFKDRFQQRVQDYFGEQAVDRYEDARRQSDFQQTVSTQLAALADWVRNHRAESNWRNEQGYNRLVAATEALIEYFLVEATRKLHGGIWPQRLLRHQALSWDKADLFSMAMDYLDFEDESETYYTDFVRMPARVLKNATNRFLNATRDERVLFVCDQSLLGSGKDGYALTDVAIYWRPVLQGPQRVLYQEIETLEKQADHLRINGLYFDAGASLNYKMALLLRRLATMISTYAA